jgi:hypothetical protein
MDLRMGIKTAMKMDDCSGYVMAWSRELLMARLMVLQTVL